MCWKYLYKTGFILIGLAGFERWRRSFLNRAIFYRRKRYNTQDTNKQNLLSSHGQSPQTMSSAAQSEDLVDDVNCNDIVNVSDLELE